MKPFRLLDTNTARSVYLSTVGGEYPSWLLWPAGRDRTSDALIQNPEWPMVVRASRLLAPDADLVCVDVGSNLGARAIPLAKLRPRTTVWAFEAGLQPFLHLCTHAFLNGLSSNLRPEHLALGAAPGLLPLYLPDARDSTTATLRPSADALAVEVVRTVRLADHDVARQCIHLLLLDVPDYTVPILRGGMEALHHWETPVIVRLPERAHADATACLRTELGYELAELETDYYLAAPPKRLRGLLRRSRA